MSVVVVMDAGNSAIRAILSEDGRMGKPLVIPHGLYEVNAREYKSLQRTAVNTEGFIAVNGRYYLVGAAALERLALPRRGAQRYQKGYMDILVAATLSRLLEGRNNESVTMFMSYPPKDEPYRSSLVKTVQNLTITHPGTDSTLCKVERVYTFPEPQGGWAATVLTAAGKLSAMGKALAGQTALVLDIGSHTTDLLSIGASGGPDGVVNTSFVMGINQVRQKAEDEMRVALAEVLFGTNALSPAVLDKALRTKQLMLGAVAHDVADPVEAALLPLLGNIRDTVASLTNGILNYGAVILTGGGSALLFDYLIDPELGILGGHQQIVTASRPETLHLANVTGGVHLWTLLENSGKVK